MGSTNLIDVLPIISNNETQDDAKMRPEITKSAATICFVVFCCILLIICVVGNALVVASFASCPLLKVLTNYWIVSLSMTDIVLAILVFPLQIKRELHDGMWTLGPIWCDFFITVDVLCCTCSIYHLCLISLDRNFCVQFPFAYMRWRTKKMTLGAIALTWLLCALISVIRFFGLQDVQRNPFLCVMTNKVYALLSSVLSFYFPLAVIMCMYFAIWRKTHKRSKRFVDRSSHRVRNDNVAWTEFQDFRSNGTTSTYSEPSAMMKNSTSTGFTLSCSSKSSTTISHMIEQFVHSTSFQALLSTTLTPTDQNGARNGVNNKDEIFRLKVRETKSDSSNLDEILSENSENQDVPPSKANNTSMYSRKLPAKHKPFRKSDSLWECMQIKRLNQQTNSTAVKQGGPGRPPAPALSATERASSYGSRLTRRLQKQEKRAAKVVLLVLLAFVVFWTPFFFFNVMEALCGDDCSNFITPLTWTIVTWMGYCNSAVNPFIYTCFNKTFRRAIFSVCSNLARKFLQLMTKLKPTFNCKM